MTLAAIFTFFRSPLGRYLAITVAATGLFLGLRAHFIHQGQLEGRQSAADQFTAQLATEKAADRQLLKEHLEADNAKDAAQTAAFNKAVENEKAAALTIQGLIAERAKA